MTRENYEDFENSTKYWICDNVYVEGSVKITDNFNISGNYRDSAFGDCNIKVKLNHEIPIVFYKLKNYDSHIMQNRQKIGKFDFKLNFTPNGLGNI